MGGDSMEMLDDSPSTNQSLMEQNQRLIQKNRNLVEENAKLMEENVFLQEECQRQNMTNAKLLLQLDKYDLKLALCENRMGVRSQSVTSLQDVENAVHSSGQVSPQGSPRQRMLSASSISSGGQMSKRRGSFGSSPRLMAVDSERGMQGAIGRWSSKDLLGPQRASSWGRGPVRGLVLRVGHLLHPVPELECYADFLLKQGFDTRESLAGLTENLADDFGIPLPLANALREEVTQKKLKQRYSGAVQPLQEIEIATTEAPRLRRDPYEMTPQGVYRMSSKEPKSLVCKQVLRVGHRLHAPWELEKYARILEDHNFTTRESLQQLGEQEAMRMRVPMKLANALREKAIQDTIRERGGPRTARRSSAQSSISTNRSSGYLGNSPQNSPRTTQRQPERTAVASPQTFSSPQTSQHSFNQNFMPQPLSRQPLVAQPQLAQNSHSHSQAQPSQARQTAMGFSPSGSVQVVPQQPQSPLYAAEARQAQYGGPQGLLNRAEARQTRSSPTQGSMSSVSWSTPRSSCRNLRQ